jgi:signal transduction histidine kinase
MRAMPSRLFPRPQTLQARLLLALALIGIVPLGIVGLGVATLDRQVLIEHSGRELSGLARGLAGQLQVYLAEVLSDARMLAALPEIVSMDSQRQASLLKEFFLQQAELAHLSIFDRSGSRLASSHATGAPSIANRESFQETVRRGQQTWEVVDALSTGRLAFSIRTPIRNADRHIVGVLGTVVDLENLSSVIGKVPIGGGGRAFVLDASGRILFHPDRAVVLERRDYAWIGLPSGGRPASPGTMQYEAGDESYIAGYAPVPNIGWTVVVEQPEAEVLAPARRSWNLALAGLVMSTTLALCTAIFLARTLARPVRELAVAARALGAGDVSTMLPAITRDTSELGMLVGAFASMREAVIQREEAVHRLNEELEQRVIERTGQLQATNRALEVANKELEAFSYSVAHDLRSPLRAMNGYARILLDDYAPQYDAQAQHYLRRMSENALRMGLLIDNLLAFSHLSRQPFNTQPVVLANMVRQVMADLQRECKDRRMDISVGQLPDCQADPALLTQVWVNLLENALKFTRGREMARIEVGCQHLGDEPVYFVRDNGVGFDMQYAHKLFGVFERLHRAEDYEGTGVGLALVQRIIQRHGGRIWAEAAVNQGATFFFTLATGKLPHGDLP